MFRESSSCDFEDICKGDSCTLSRSEALDEGHRCSVNFDVDQDGNINEHVIDSKTYLTELDRAALWWSRSEYAEFTLQTRVVVSHFCNNRPEYRKELAKLFGQCTQSSNVHEYRFQYKKVLRASRGIETHLNNVFSEDRQRSKALILTLQDKYVDSRKRANLLAGQYARLSAPARNLARFLAEQDAITVLDLVKPESRKQDQPLKQTLLTTPRVPARQSRLLALRGKNTI